MYSNNIIICVNKLIRFNTRVIKHLEKKGKHLLNSDWLIGLLGAGLQVSDITIISSTSESLKNKL